MPNRSITTQELDLLTFFEVEPTRVNPDVPWPYSELLYTVKRGDFDISFAISPAYRDIHLVVKRGGDTLYELNALGIDDVRYRKDSSGETLELALTARDSLFLRLVPEVSLRQDVSDELAERA